MAKAKKAPVSKSTRLGLTLPIARIEKTMRASRIAGRRVGGTASTYATAALENVIDTIVKAAIDEAQTQNGKQLLPRHIQLAVSHNDELAKLFVGVSMVASDPLPDVIGYICTKEQMEKRQKKALEAREKLAKAKAAKAAAA